MSELHLLSDEEAVASRQLLHVYGRMLSAPGTLHVTTKRIVFEPSGRLDRTLGARRVSVPLRLVESIEYRGKIQIRLVLKTPRTEHVFLDRRRDEALVTATRAAVEAFRAQAPAPAVHPPEKHSEELLDPHSRPVLLLGDTDFYGTPLRELLENLEIETCCVASAAEAINEYDENLGHLALVILNLLENREATEEVLAHVLESGHAGEVPIWVIEPLFDKPAPQPLDDAGVTAYLDKSHEPNSVSDRVNQLLRGDATPEHRRQPRVSAHFAASVQAGDHSREAYARTIGMGGCFLETRDPCPLGTSVGVHFRLPESEEVLQLAGEVVYMRPEQSDGPNAPGMGIKFRDVQGPTREAIETYIREKIRYKVNESTVTFGL